MVRVRILDLDAGRLMQEEAMVKRAFRKLKQKAYYSMVSDNLAITRQGLLDKVPVLEVNGTIVSHSRPLVFEEVVKWLRACKLQSCV